MANDLNKFLSFSLEKSLEQQDLLRAQIYRGMAAICGDEHDREKLLNLAECMTTAHKLCHELEFSFIQGNTDTASDGNGDGKGGDGQ